MDCKFDAYPMSLRESLVFCNWKDPQKLHSIPSPNFWQITDKPSCFSLINSESTTSAEKIWELWEDAVEKQNSKFKINGASWAEGEKKWAEGCNLISGKAIWIQHLPIYKEESAHELNSKNIERFNRKILKEYEIEQVHVNPKSPLAQGTGN